MNEPTRRKFLKRGGKTLAAGAMIAGLPGPRRMGARGDDGRRPNILFFFPDQHRFDWIGGNPKIPVRTPNLDRVARRGVKFNKAVVASPLCAPSRGCLASGKEYDRARVASNGVDYPLDQTTFYSLLRASGYHVAGCGKFDLHKKSETWGLDGKHLLPEWGFSDGIDNAGKWDAIRSGMKKPKDPYMGFLERHGLRETHIKDFLRRRGDRKNYSVTDPTPLPEDAYCDNWIAQNGISPAGWMRSAGAASSSSLTTAGNSIRPPMSPSARTTRRWSKTLTGGWGHSWKKLTGGGRWTTR